MATKKAQTAKVAPKATKTVKTTSGKTKTVPAKKPASKPAPKTTTVKTDSKGQPKHKYTTGAIIASIIGAIAVIALVTIGIIAICNNLSHKSDSSLIVENGDGEKVTTKYINFNNDSFRIKIPDALKVTETPSNNTNTNVLGAYVNDEGNVSLAVMTNGDAKISNDQIKGYLETMKNTFSAAGTVINSDYYTKGDYNVATMRISISSGNQEIYQDIVVFSQNDQLVMINITYDKSEEHKWEPVNKFIINSLEFLK